MSVSCSRDKRTVVSPHTDTCCGGGSPQKHAGRTEPHTEAACIDSVYAKSQKGNAQLQGPGDAGSLLRL